MGEVLTKKLWLPVFVQPIISLKTRVSGAGLLHLYHSLHGLQMYQFVVFVMYYEDNGEMTIYILNIKSIL